MAPEIRSHSGCWTCRVRRKKCDEIHPICTQCLSAEVTCHGFGEKPEWMDGGARESAEIGRIKLQVVSKTKRRKILLRQHRQNSSAEQSPQSTPTKLGSPQAQQRDMITSLAAQQKSYIEAVSTTFPENGNSNLTSAVNPPNWSLDSINGYDGSLPSTPLIAPALTVEDATILAYYLDKVFHWQFPFHEEKNLNKGHFLWLITHSRPLYLAMAALSASHMKLCGQSHQEHDEGTNIGTDDLTDRYHLAIKEIQRSLSVTQDSDPWQAQIQHVSTIACIVMFLSINVLHGGRYGWQIHLRSGIELIRPWISRRILEPTTPSISDSLDSMSQYTNISSYGVIENMACTSNETIIEALTGLLARLIIKFEILSRHYYDTGIRYDQQALLLDSPLGASLESTLGCQNWVTAALLMVYSLRDWKWELQATNTLSIWELTTKARPIQQALQDGIAKTVCEITQHEQIPMINSRNDRSTVPRSDITIFAITYTYACGVLLVLETVVSGAYPELPEIRRQVAQIIAAYQNFQELRLIDTVRWPLFLAGSMAEASLHERFRELIPLSALQHCASVTDLMSVIEECWRVRRSQEQLDQPVDVAAVMKSLGLVLLIG